MVKVCQFQMKLYIIFWIVMDSLEEYPVELHYSQQKQQKSQMGNYQNTCKILEWPIT